MSDNGFGFPYGTPAPPIPVKPTIPATPVRPTSPCVSHRPSAGRSRNFVPDKIAGRTNSEQQALIDMAARDSMRLRLGRSPITAEDANAYIELANEAGVPVRAKPNDLAGQHGYGDVPPGPDAAHIHINGKHVPVPPGYSPPSHCDIIR